MNRRFLQRLLGEIRALDDHQKECLQGILRNADRNILAICGWVRVLDSLMDEGIPSTESLEKEAVLKHMEVGISGVKKGDLHKKVLGTYLGLPPDISTEIVLERFTSWLVLALRRQRSVRLKAHLASLLIQCSPTPQKGVTSEDYLWAIHHPEELIRCRALLFLRDHYGEEVLESTWGAIVRDGEEPTFPVLGTLMGLLQCAKRGGVLERIQGLSTSQGSRVLRLTRHEQRKTIPRFFLLPFVSNRKTERPGPVQTAPGIEPSGNPPMNQIKERFELILKAKNKRGGLQCHI
jgi:hypothetical protein